MHGCHGNRMQSFQTEKIQNDFENFVKKDSVDHSATKQIHLKSCQR